MSKKFYKIKRDVVMKILFSDNEIIDIEYNNCFGLEEKRRNVAYLSNIYSVSVKSGGKYKNQPNCIQINLCSKLNDKYDKEIHKLYGNKYHSKLVDNMNFYVFNIDYYKRLLYNKSNKKLINKYKHLIMFDCNLEELKKLAKGDQIMEKIYNKVKEINDEDAIYNYMSIEEDDEKMWLSKLDNAMEKGISIGVERGIERGIEHGIERGISIGFESGKIETLNDTTLALLKNNIPLNVIEDVTGYSKDYIQSLKC